MAATKSKAKKSSSLSLSFSPSSLPPMMVSVIVRDVEGGAVCAGAGVEGPAPLLLSAGSGTRKTRWPSIAAVFYFFFSLSLFSLLPLALSTQRGVPCCRCCYRERAPVLSPPRKRGRRGGSSGHRGKKEELKTKKKICETKHHLSSPRVFSPLPLVFPHSPSVAALMPRDLLLEAPRGAISFFFFTDPNTFSVPLPLLLLLFFFPSYHHPEVAPRQAPHPPVEPAAPRRQQARQASPGAAPAAAQRRGK